MESWSLRRILGFGPWGEPIAGARRSPPPCVQYSSCCRERQREGALAALDEGRSSIACCTVAKSRNKLFGERICKERWNTIADLAQSRIQRTCKAKAVR